MIAVAPASGNLTFEVGAVETMRFDDEFDLVVSFNALHWVTDQRRALSAVRAALHVGGRAVLVFVCGGPRPSVEDVAMSVTATPRWSGSFGGFSRALRAPGTRAMAKGCDVGGTSGGRRPRRRPVVGLRVA